MNNDIVTKARLNAALGTEGNMGFEHNDIVTVDKMNEAIAEGGGSSDFSTAQVTISALPAHSHFNAPLLVDAYEKTVADTEADSVGTYTVILHDGIAMGGGRFP